MDLKIHSAVLFVMLITAAFVMPVLAEAAVPSAAVEKITPTSAKKTPAKKSAPINDPTQAEAVKLLGKKKYAEACGLLDAKYPADTTEPGILFLRARCRMGMKDYQAAYRIYQRLAIISPDSARIKQELSVVEKIVRPPPKPKKESNNWFARAEGSLIYDTNINSGPQSNEILILGNPVILGAGSAPIDSAGFSLSGLWGYLHSLGGTNFLLTKVTAEHTDYFHPGDFSFDSYSFSVGPIYSFGDTRLTLSPGATWQSYAGDAYSSSLDFGARVSHKINDKINLGLRLTAAKNNYLTVEGRDGIAASLTPNIEFKPYKKTTATLSLIGRFDNTDNSTYSSDTLGYRIALEQALTDKVKINFAMQNTRRKFESPDIAFSPDPRTDKLNTKTIGLSWDISNLTSPSTSLNFRYQYVANKSSSPIYSYGRETTTFSIAKSW